MKPDKIQIAANFTIEPVAGPMASAVAILGISASIEFSPYNQIFQQLLDPGSGFNTNASGVNVIFLRIEDLIDSKETGFELSAVDLEKISENAVQLGNALSVAASFANPLTIVICPPSAGDGRHEAVRAISDEFAEVARNTVNCQVLEIANLDSRYGLANIDNPAGRKLANVPYTTEAFDAIAIETVRFLDIGIHDPFKVLVLDCDNTIWDGVVGEAGVDGIGISENRRFLQQMAVKLSETGTLICLCSKNNEADVWEVFDKRDDMILKREHIAAAKVNWLPKSENLKMLARELSLGADSFVFVDDDAAVCSEVEMNCPEVLTILLPEATGSFAEYFEHLWVFDKAKVTSEDRARTDSYKKLAMRNTLQAKATNLEDFLNSLDLKCVIADATEEDIPRVSQLSLRTNQFNSTTVRRSESDFRGLSADDSNKVWTVRVSDRFGDYGLVGVVVIFERAATLLVDSFMLSCRVLGRGVEHKILESLGKRATDAGLETISIEFVRSAKNAPFENFLKEVVGDPVEGANVISANTALNALNLLKTRKTGDDALPAGRSKPSAPKPAQAFNKKGYLKIADLLSKRLPLTGIADSVGVARADSEDILLASSATEVELTKIWETLLKLSGIGIRDDFFRLGGDSLMAVSLFVEVEERFGRSLPLSALIEAPTIEKLAGLIDSSESNTDRKYLVPIQTGSSERPIFCMHAAGGNVLFYRDLASELGAEQTVFGVQARGVANKTETAHDNVAEMAREYLSEIREAQPNGPYRLCGSSFGGLVAFEIARQLREVGEVVEILALFDTYAPGYLKANSIKRNGAKSGVRDRFANLLQQLNSIETMRGRIEFVAGRLHKLRIRAKRRFIWKKNEFAIQYGKATGKELPVDVQRNHRAIQKALETFNPSQFDGDMILFRASDQPKNVEFDEFLGWRNFVHGEVVTLDVTGAHGSLTVHPFASELASKFRPFLDTHSELTEKTSAVAA